MMATATGAERTAPAASRERFQPGWMAPALIAGFPLWWALGLGELIFPIAGLAMLWDLSRRREVMVPRTFGMYAAFIVAVATSGLMLDKPSEALGWITRTAQYVGVGMILPYCLTHRRNLSSTRLLRSLVWLWIAAVAGGVAALVLGPVSFPTPMKYLLPGGISSNPFVFEQVNPSLADVDGFLGFTSVRPKAPFTYTNGWGAALGLLFPVAAYAAVCHIGIPRWLVRLSLILGTVPIVFSLNRGLWVSIAAACAYGSVLLVRRHGSRVVVGLILGAVIAATVIAVSPLGGLIEQRAENGHSDEDRAELYLEVISELKESPFFGYGGPRPTEDGPPLGTHGQLWIVLFSYGLVGAILYFGFMAVCLVESTGGRTGAELVAHTVLVISGLQVFFYGHVPQQLAIIFVAITIGNLCRFEAVDAAEERDLAGLRNHPAPLPVPMSFSTTYGAPT
jgi:hypothetical protein